MILIRHLVLFVFVITFSFALNLYWVKLQLFSAAQNKLPSSAYKFRLQKLSLMCCKERFPMNSLFASNFLSTF